MRAPSHTMSHVTSQRRRVGALVVLTAFALLQGVVPALSIDEAEVERAREQREQAARERAAAIQDLDAAVASYEALNAELAQLTYKTGRMRQQIDLYESRSRDLRDVIRERAVDSYMHGDERDPLLRVFDPAQVQQTLIAREVLALAVDADTASLDSLLATTAEMTRLRTELEEDSARVSELRVEADAVVARMNELFAAAQAQFEEADATATRAENALAEQRRREEEERRRREEEQRQIDAIRASLGAPSLGVPMSVTPGFICPIAAPTSFIDSWGFPRSGGRSHQGVDMFAKHMAPLVAVANGTIKMSYNSLGGNVVWLYADHGVNYFYAHLDSYPAGQVNGQRVSRGTVIGYNGDTGNAAPGAYHLHFGIVPGGIQHVNPYPTVRAACP